MSQDLKNAVDLARDLAPLLVLFGVMASFGILRLRLYAAEARRWKHAPYYQRYRLANFALLKAWRWRRSPYYRRGRAGLLVVVAVLLVHAGLLAAFWLRR